VVVALLIVTQLKSKPK